MKFAHDILNKKILKIKVFNYNQHIILIINTNARFQLIGSTSNFWTNLPKLAQENMTDKNFEKINIIIVISL